MKSGSTLVIGQTVFALVTRRFVSKPKPLSKMGGINDLETDREDVVERSQLRSSRAIAQSHWVKHININKRLCRRTGLPRSVSKNPHNKVRRLFKTIHLAIRAFLRLKVNRFNTGITAWDWRLGNIEQ